MNNEYLNGYAKVFGATGTAIYISLCRHANNITQECFPSEELIAEELNINEKTVRKYLNEMAECNIISIKRERDSLTGKWKNKIYTLLDKEQWNSPPVNSSGGVTIKPPVNEVPNHRYVVPNKETNTNKTNINNTNNVLSIKELSFKDFLISLGMDKRRHVQITGLYWKFREWKFENKGQWSAALKRELKPAAALKGYTDKQILDTMEAVSREDIPKWTLETVHKYIDEVINNDNKLKVLKLK